MTCFLVSRILIAPTFNSSYTTGQDDFPKTSFFVSSLSTNYPQTGQPPWAGVLSFPRTGPTCLTHFISPYLKQELSHPLTRSDALYSLKDQFHFPPGVFA